MSPLQCKRKQGFPCFFFFYFLFFIFYFLPAVPFCMFVKMLTFFLHFKIAILKMKWRIKNENI